MEILFFIIGAIYASLVEIILAFALGAALGSLITWRIAWQKVKHAPATRQ